MAPLWVATNDNGLNDRLSREYASSTAALQRMVDGFAPGYLRVDISARFKFLLRQGVVSPGFGFLVESDSQGSLAVLRHEKARARQLQPAPMARAGHLVLASSKWGRA